MILVRVSMRLSFDDQKSFIEAAGSLRFNNPPSDQSASQEVGSTDSQTLPCKFPAIDSTLGRVCVLGSLSRRVLEPLVVIWILTFQFPESFY